jgi:hydroxyacylglutathione hydrolase
MKALVLPILADNRAYLAVEGGDAVAVDPGEAAPVIEAARASGATIRVVLLTHGHADHTAGAAELRDRTGCAVVGPDECRPLGLDRVVGEGDLVGAGAMRFRVLSTPGHTRSHVCYHAPDALAVWTGDTLFAGGCGRVVEGSAARMWESLRRLRDLPPETGVYVGHDYTDDNLEFAATILPDDAPIRERLAHVRRRPGADRSAAATTIAVERATNIFLRSDDPAVRRALGLRDADPAAVFAELRRRKDAW